MTGTFTSFEDAIRVIQSVRDPNVKDVALVILHSGVRLGECLALRQQDVDLEQSRIYIYPYRGPGWAVVPINTTVKSILEERLSVPKEFVFIGKRGRPLTASYCNALFRDAARNTGIDVTIRDLRRICVQSLFRQGISLIAISKITGTSPPLIWRYVLDDPALVHRMQADVRFWSGQ